MRLSSLLPLPAALIAGLFFACGGQVDVGGQPGPTPTGTTTTPTISPTGTTTSPTVTPTGTTTSTVEPPTPVCAHTSDRLDISLSGALNGSCATLGPDGPSTPKKFTGQIVKVGRDSLVVDICPPTADCVASLVTVNVKGAGLDLGAIPNQSLVTVTADFVMSWGCTSTILVQSIAEWDGQKNPVDVGGRTYLVGADGTTNVDGAPFSVTRVATGCMAPPPFAPCGPEKPDDYLLSFSSPGAGPTSIAMGSTAYFSAGSEMFAARNLRAYYSGACDAYWDYAFWAVSEPFRGD